MVLTINLRRFAVSILAASLATAAAAETHSIGTLGATIPTGSWERGTFSADLGPDQFLRIDRNYFLVVLENFELYEQRADFEESIDLYLSGIKARLRDLDLDPEMGYSRSSDFTRATRRFSGITNGVEISYQLDLVSAGDGVGYLFMSWSASAGFEGLQEQIERTLDELKLPGPDSEWGQRTRPSDHALDFEGWTVEARFRDSVFTESDSVPGERYSFAASDGDIALHIFLDELEGDADDVLDQVKRVATDVDSPYEELSRSDLDLELGPARQVWMRSEGQEPAEMAIAVIGLGDDRWVDVRMVTADRAGVREELWEGLLRSIRVTPPEAIDAFPIVADAPEAETGYIGPSARRLLTESRLLGAQGSEVVAVRDDDTLLVRESDRLVLVPASGSEDGSAEVLYRSDGYLQGKLVTWGERIFRVAVDGEVSELVAGRLQPAGFEADVVAAGGEELLIARNGRQEELFGIADLPTVGPAEILGRGADGEERLLAELPAKDVTALAHRPTGDVLVATAPRTSLSSDTEASAKRLVLLRGGKGRAQEIARWEQIDRLEPTSDGWLVTGESSPGSKGVHLVGDDGHSELLLSGDPSGVSLADGELIFVTQSCLEPVEGFLSRCVYRASLDRVRELGPAFQPFTAQVLDQIGVRVQLQGDGDYLGAFPPTREAISRVSDAAGEAALELVGTDLPRSGAGVDALLATLVYDRELSEPGVVLLSVLLTDALVREGAVWEAAAEPTLPARSTLGWVLKNPFAVGLHPVRVVLSTLYEEEGWYNPAESLGREVGGRTLVLGLDPETIRARVRTEDRPELDDLLQGGRVSRLAAVLQDHPDNVHLRETVYKHLAAHGHRTELASLAEPFARGDDAQGVDVVAWMAARLAGEPSQTELAEAIAALRDAIEKQPGHTGLYLLLGAAYERSAEPDRLALARASYRQAEKTAPWGSLRTAAEQALERLADAE